jgi:hypothetical protein
MIDEKDKVLPELPRKIYIGRANVRRVAEKRREALDKYLEAFVKLEKKIVTCPPAKQFFELRPTDLDPGSEDKTSGRKSPFAFFKKEKDEQTERTSTGQQISQPLQLEQYRAISNYKKSNREQMDLSTDQVYDVISKDTSGWWLLKKGEHQGWVPASYLEPLHHDPEQDFLPKSEVGEQVISVKEYKSSGEFKDELSFPKHAVMKVIYKTLDGWWYVRYNETNGYVPAAYLQPLKETQTFGAKEKQQEQPAVENAEVAAKRKFFGAPPRRESLLNVSTIHAPLKQRHEVAEPVIKESETEEQKEEEEEEEEESEEASDTTDEMVEAEPYRAAADYDGENDEEVSFKVGDEVDVMTKTDSGWWYVCVNDNLKGWAPATYLEPVNVIEEKNKMMDTTEDSDNEKYVSTGEYLGQDEDEISFPEGVIVTVLHKYMDGWWYVSYNNGKGYAPSSFLEPAVDTKKADEEKVDVPFVKVRAASIRNRAIPRKATIENFDTIFAAMGIKKSSEKVVEEEEEETDSGVSPLVKPLSSPVRKQLSGDRHQLPRPRQPPPQMPARPSAEQLQRCTVQVRVAYSQPEPQMVRPIPVRPDGYAQQSTSPTPLGSGLFRPVSPKAFGDSGSEHSDDNGASSEISPNSPSSKPSLPASRRSLTLPVQSNIDSETCALIKNPECQTAQAFRPRRRSHSKSPVPERPRSITPKNTPPSLSPSASSPNRLSPSIPSDPPILPPSRKISQQQRQNVYFV